MTPAPRCIQLSLTQMQTPLAKETVQQLLNECLHSSMTETEHARYRSIWEEPKSTDLVRSESSAIALNTGPSGKTEL